MRRERGGARFLLLFPSRFVLPLACKMSTSNACNDRSWHLRFAPISLHVAFISSAHDERARPPQRAISHSMNGTVSLCSMSYQTWHRTSPSVYLRSSSPIVSRRSFVSPRCSGGVNSVSGTNDASQTSRAHLASASWRTCPP